jgi:DNA-binding transcriptional LysR family regulator
MVLSISAGPAAMRQSLRLEYTVAMGGQPRSAVTNLNELHYFALVAQSRSFTVAARRLGLPKSSVSRAIARLEQRLGVQLIERTTRSVRLTEAGRLYFVHSQRVIDEAEQADIAIGAMMAVPRGKLRIGAPVAFARFVLGPRMNQFLATYPELRVHIEILHAREREVDEGFDLVVRVGPLEDSGWLVKPLMQVRLGLYASPEFLKRNRRPESAADLRQYPCIVSTCGPPGEPGDYATWRLRREREVRETQVIARISVPDPSVHRQLALTGAGIAMLGQAEVETDLKERRLVRVLPEWEPEPIALFALYPSRLAASPKVRVLLEFLERHRDSSRKAGELVPDSA